MLRCFLRRRSVDLAMDIVIAALRLLVVMMIAVMRLLLVILIIRVAAYPFRFVYM